MGSKDDLRLQLRRTGDRGIEFVRFEPEQQAVSVRLRVGIADWPVMMFDFPMVELENELPARDQPLVLRTAVRALASEQPLIPTAARFDIMDGDQRLWTHHPDILSDRRRGTIEKG